MRTLYRNGRIWTMDPTLLEAEAMLVDGERFVAVGTVDQLKAELRPGDAVVDLAGQTVVPGLIDAHVHFSWFSQGLTEINLDGVATLAEALVNVNRKLDHPANRKVDHPGGGVLAE